jgi:hypothetical protein
MSFGKYVGSVVVVGAVALSACGGDATAESSTTQASDVAPTTTATATTIQPENLQPGEVPMSEALDPAGSADGGTAGPSYIEDSYPTELGGIVGLAIADLADRNSVDTAAIAVVLVEEVVWRDASLGCPQPDMSYAQVITDGLRIVLEADGLLYDYRSGGLTDPVLCVQAVDTEKTRAGIFHVTEAGEVIILPRTDGKSGVPTEGVNPPDK